FAGTFLWGQVFYGFLLLSGLGKSLQHDFFQHSLKVSLTSGIPEQPEGRHEHSREIYLHRIALIYAEFKKQSYEYNL
ncbi:hypothetical protein ACJX0J_033052, partial [Zea mays]